MRTHNKILESGIYKPLYIEMNKPDKENYLNVIIMFLRKRFLIALSCAKQYLNK